MNTQTRRKSTLFLVEQLIVIAVFALCAVACISILTASFFMARDSKDTANALIIAQNCAETLKAPGSSLSFGFMVYYDKDWKAIRTSESAAFVLTISGDVSLHDGDSFFYDGTVAVNKINGESLVSLPVAVIRK